MSVKPLTEYHLEFLSLKDGCTGSSESTLVKMPHCWKSHITAQMCFKIQYIQSLFMTTNRAGHGAPCTESVNKLLCVIYSAATIYVI